MQFPIFIFISCCIFGEHFSYLVLVLGMKSEIHRMSIKHQSLLREKEDLITEMERCVDRRGHIGTKARIQTKKGTNRVDNIKKEVT